MNASEIKKILQLEPHPCESGWFGQTYVSRLRYSDPQGERATATAIHYLIETDSFSEMHVLASNEVFQFYLGDPVEMLQL